MSPPTFEYMRVKDKATKHRYDILVNKFNPEVHEEVKTGPYKEHSSYARRPQVFVPKKGEKKPSKPSGEAKSTESEDS